MAERAVGKKVACDIGGTEPFAAPALGCGAVLRPAAEDPPLTALSQGDEKRFGSDLTLMLIFYIR